MDGSWLVSDDRKPTFADLRSEVGAARSWDEIAFLAGNLGFKERSANGLSGVEQGCIHGFPPYQRCAFP